MADEVSLLLAQLPAAQRKLLQMSVHMNPVIVANADGQCSLRESRAIAEAVRKLISENEYRPLVLVAGHEEITDAALRVMLETYGNDIDAYLTEVAALVRQLPKDVADAYRRFTVYAIVAVAEASRDGLFGLVGERISQSEKSVMRRMVELLALPIDDETRDKLGM